MLFHFEICINDDGHICEQWKEETSISKSHLEFNHLEFN